MTTPNQCLASLARLSIKTPYRPVVHATIPRVLAPAAIAQQRRNAATTKPGANVKEKKVSKFYPAESLKRLPKFSLCDAMRCLRAHEVGQDPFSIKYDIAIKLKTLRTGPTIRSRVILPNTVSSNRRIGVICKEGSPLAEQAVAAGAVVAGEESVFSAVRDGTIDFTAMICLNTYADSLKRANLGRILGPKGLMPTVNSKTITPDVLGLLKEMNTAEVYLEKKGVVRFPIGQLWFSPDMLSENVKAAVQQVRKDCQALVAQTVVPKQVFDVVLSTSNGPGFSLNGFFAPTQPGITVHALSGPM